MESPPATVWVVYLPRPRWSFPPDHGLWSLRRQTESRLGNFARRTVKSGTSWEVGELLSHGSSMRGNGPASGQALSTGDPFGQTSIFNRKAPHVSSRPSRTTSLQGRLSFIPTKVVCDGQPRRSGNPHPRWGGRAICHLNSLLRGGWLTRHHDDADLDKTPTCE